MDQTFIVHFLCSHGHLKLCMASHTSVCLQHTCSTTQHITRCVVYYHHILTLSHAAPFNLIQLFHCCFIWSTSPKDKTFELGTIGTGFLWAISFSVVMSTALKHRRRLGVFITTTGSKSHPLHFFLSWFTESRVKGHAILLCWLSSVAWLYTLARINWLVLQSIQWILLAVTFSDM